MKSNYDILGNHIRLIDTRNRESITDRVLGINIDKFFMPSVANVIGTDLSKYKLITKGKFACNPMHVGRDERLPVALYDEEEPAIVSPAYFMFEVIDNSILNKDYLMMWFRRPEFDRICWLHTDGSVRGGITWDDICRLELPIPPIEKQIEIVNSYKAITERIALKQKINDNLEAQLTTLFKEKILDSDELAVVEPLDLNIDFINGLAMQNFRLEENEEFLPVIKIRELSQGYCDNNSEFCTDKIDKSHIINKGDLVFSWSGSLQVAFWTSDRAGLNQHLFKVVSATYPQWYVYLWVKHHLLNFQRIAENKGTTFGHIKREDLHSAMIKTVDEYTIASLNKVFSPILSAYLKNAAEVHRLADVQKVLLARLSR